MSKQAGTRAEPSKASASVRAGAGKSTAVPGSVELYTPRTRLQRFVILTAGVIAAYFVLYAPSLLGYKVLLPLDSLSNFATYLPLTPEYAEVHPQNSALSDQVLQFEFQRRFAAQEFRAGRVPLWDPYHYCGAPFVAPFLTPFHIPYYILPHYVVLAWIRVLVALVAAGGAYVFFRRVLGVGFWPAAVAAWCLPLTGFFQLWLGFYLSYTAAFLPWLLIAVDSAIQRPAGWGGPAIALVTGLLLVSGAFDLAGQVLLTSGLFALWRLGELYRSKQSVRTLVAPVIALSVGWLLGFLLAAPYWMLLTEYAANGLRIQLRAANKQVERPPWGLAALPQMVLPYFYGSTWRGCTWLSPAGNLQESAAQAYTGLIATLVVAPLGLASRRLRSLNLFWALLCVFASAWMLNLPGLTAFLRLPGMNLMSHNRFLFVVCFAMLAMAAAGLDALARGEVVWRIAFILPIVLLIILGIGSIYRATNINDVVPARAPVTMGDRWIEGSTFPQLLASAREQLSNYYFEATAFCAAALLVWLLVMRAPARVAFAVVGLLMLGELLWTERGQNTQSDPALYYPEIPQLNRLQQAPPGRVVGIKCLPPLLAQRYDRWDLRGYDAVDPIRIVKLLLKLKDERSPAGTKGFEYAAVQWWWPKLGNDPNFKAATALDMLNLRYVIGRGDGVRNLFQPKLIDSGDYWVYENPDALPRVFIPKRVQFLQDESRILGKLTEPPMDREFDPRLLAYVESDPHLQGEARGTAEIVGAEKPCEIHVAVDMETPGLLVLADQWDAGWKAYLNGTSLPVIRTNYAIRGVPVPAGHGEVVFRYEPRGWSRGLKVFGGAAVFLIAWALLCAWLTRRPRLRPQPN